MSRISTGTGDAGTTGLVGGARVPKTHPRVEACGAIDEANDVLGVAASLAEGDLRARIQSLQRDLFVVGADVAAPPGVQGALRVEDRHVAAVEGLTDELEAALPPLRRFILPGGAPVAAHLQLARSVVRRAERRLWDLPEAERAGSKAAVYLNRLSDCLFLLAREANRRAGVEEPQWEGKA